MMERVNKGDKKMYVITVVIAIALLGLLLLFVNVKSVKNKDKETSKTIAPTTEKKILKDKLEVDGKEINIEVEECVTPGGLTLKYEPLYFKVGADDKIIKFTSIIDKNTYLIIEKLTEEQVGSLQDINKTVVDGDYSTRTRLIKNGMVYLKATKHHKTGAENDNIDIRMEYIIQQLK